MRVPPDAMQQCPLAVAWTSSEPPLLAPQQELTSRDRSQAANLADTLEHACPAWAEELRQMLGSGAKADLEALDTAGDLPDLLERCIMEGDFV